MSSFISEFHSKRATDHLTVCFSVAGNHSEGKETTLGRICVADENACLVPEIDNPGCASFRAPLDLRLGIELPRGLVEFSSCRETLLLMPWLQVVVNEFHIILESIRIHSSFGSLRLLQFLRCLE